MVIRLDGPEVPEPAAIDFFSCPACGRFKLRLGQRLTACGSGMRTVCCDCALSQPLSRDEGIELHTALEGLVSLRDL